MKTINKHLIILFAGLLALTGCDKKNSDKDNNIPLVDRFGVDMSPTSSGKAKVIIIKPMEHPSLEACINGFREGLADGGYGEGKVDIEVLDASGNFADIPSLTKTAIAKNPNVIFTVTTSAAAAAIKITDKHIPLVYSAVTDPVQAGIVTAMDHSDTMATGTSDRYNVCVIFRLARFADLGITAMFALGGATFVVISNLHCPLVLGLMIWRSLLLCVQWSCESIGGHRNRQHQAS